MDEEDEGEDEDEDVVEDERRKAIEELVRGRECANQLRRQIININKHDDDDDDDDDAAAATNHLLSKVLKSFANTLLLFSKYPSYQSMLLHHPAASNLLLKSQQEQYTNSIKSTSTDRRGSPKRKRIIETGNKVSGTQTDHDDHQWRKYGQKRIQNAKYERNYYRCTHKYDQGCQAKKQVQMIREEPTPSYRVTYYGHHTCTNPAHQIVLLHDYSTALHVPSSSNSSILLSFDNSFPNPTNIPFFSTSSSTMNIIAEQCNNHNNTNKKEGDPVAPSSSLSRQQELERQQQHHVIPSSSTSSHQQLQEEEYWDTVMMPSWAYDYGTSLDDYYNF